MGLCMGSKLSCIGYIAFEPFVNNIAVPTIHYFCFLYSVQFIAYSVPYAGSAEHSLYAFLYRGVPSLSPRI